MDFFANNTPMTLRIFTSGNALIDSLTISNVGLPIGSPFSFPFGFIGLNAGSAIIDHAIIEGRASFEAGEALKLLISGAFAPNTVCVGSA